MRGPAFPFSVIPEGKAAANVTRFEVVDDFNSGIGRGKWEALAPDGSRIRLVPEREDAVNPWGGSLAANFSIQADEEAKLIASLSHLDLSRAKAIAFLMRKSELESFPGTVFVRLRSRTGDSKAVQIKRYLNPVLERAKPGWDQVVIPRSAYRTFDFNQVQGLEISIRSERETSGKLVFDEIAFFGAEDLVFESARDNLIGFPKEATTSARREELLRIADDQQLLREIAKDTWRYFENLVDRETGLVVDHVRVGKTTGIGSYISPTTVALHWLATVAAWDLGLISKKKAVEIIHNSLDTFQKLERWRGGFWYNYYHTRSLHVTRNYVSTVDNGWLAAALVVIRRALPESFDEEATKLLGELDFSVFYDEQNGQLKLGYNGDRGAFEPYHYGLLATEARLTSYVAIGKGDLGEAHWARIYRTLPQEWDWQRQIPEGSEEELFGVPVFEGHYTYLNQNFIPSWGGSLFEFLAPTVVVNEQKFGPQNLGKNNQIVTDLHIEHALEKEGYPIWGLAPCAVSSGKGWAYREYGIPELGAKGYRDDGIIAPYASLLALEIRPKEVISNIRELLQRYDEIYGEYGFYDSVHALKGAVNQQYLALDQGLMFLALANYLSEGRIRGYFHSDPVGEKAGNLLAAERFSTNITDTGDS